MTLYLIRHGLAAAGLDDLDLGLAALGQEQAAVTAAALAPDRLAPPPHPRDRREVAEVFEPSVTPEERKAMLKPFMEGRWS